MVVPDDRPEDEVKSGKCSVWYLAVISGENVVGGGWLQLYLTSFKTKQNWERIALKVDFRLSPFLLSLNWFWLVKLQC